MPVTIGIPFYNAEVYIADAIRSVFAQTYQDWELLLIDDGSTDRSLEIAHSVQDSRVLVVSDGENRKLAYRLNQIISMAKYDFVARMDADDLMSPYRLYKQVAVLEARPDIDLISTGVCSISDDDDVLGIRVFSKEDPVTSLDVMLGKHGVVHASILGRKSWFKRNTYSTSEVLAEDYELWVRTTFKDDFSVHVLREPLYYYREMGNVDPAKMIRAYKSQLKVLSRYNRRNGVTRVRLTFQLKLMAVYIMSLFNATPMLLGRRNSAISCPKQKEFLKNEIANIHKCKVDGLFGRLR